VKTIRTARADVDEGLNEPNEFGAEQKEKRGDADKHDRETERSVHELCNVAAANARRALELRWRQRRRYSFSETISARRKFPARVEQDRQCCVNVRSRQMTRASTQTATGVVPNSRAMTQVNAIAA